MKDLEGGQRKVIAFKDVKFVKDKTLSDLVVVDIHVSTTTSIDINNFVNNTISKYTVKVDYKPFNINTSKTLITLLVQISASVPLFTSTISNTFIYSTPLSKLTTPYFVNNSSDNVVVLNIVASKQSKAIIPLKEPLIHI